MGSALTPTNISGAALVAHFWIILILSGGSALLGFFQMQERVSTTPLILVLTISSFGVVFFSDEFSKIWSPLFGGSEFTGVRWSTALLLVFSANIVVVAILVSVTGGSFGSPFTPVNLMLPALAIFLREPTWRVISYVVVIILLFTLNFRIHEPIGRIHRLACWGVAVACLLLTTYVGIITAPPR